ncbi:hypothetical protein BEWA_027870 [Theileria equi strain WA]|uniref:EF-hand domain-containing protein n=1 Tax=Theileria equi strain WA TaxID=1537102 RepID=L0AXH8_THEEQ|nr:hypothetical protein BEWA_027870 [Theileria equi strain WA]AFZ79938.1 hypothetical protein BEWA_027870 [Theileria equi strain WA]|eukprot:XP_004829604.1 hypothetical protein BEWA_027870 [Theileria equi strain WA]
MRVINTTTLKRVSSVVATIYYFTPFLIIFFFSVVQLLNVNESYLLKLIFGEICQNGTPNTLASIVCPIPPLRRVGELKSTNDSYTMPVIVATTKSTTGVTVKTDYATPTPLYTIVGMCSNHGSSNANHLSILNDVCDIVHGSINSSELKQKLDEANRDRHLNDDIIKWSHVSILMQKLPVSGKIWHIKWLMHMNKNKTLSKVLDAMLSVAVKSQENINHLKARTNLLYELDDPFLFAAQTAFPVFVDAELKIQQDSLKRLFAAFPEAFVAFVHARTLGFRKVNFLTFEPDTDRFTFLSVYLCTLQLLTTYVFPPIKVYNEVVDSDFLNTNRSVGTEFPSILQEFVNDSLSRVFLDKVILSVDSVGLMHDERELLFTIMEVGLQFANIFLLRNSPIKFMDGNVINRNVLIKRLRKGLILLGKFIASDTNTDGVLSFKEFINAGTKDHETILRREQDREPEQSSMRNVRIMRTREDLRDKVVEEFILSDINKDNYITLEEYMDVITSTGFHRLTIHV